MKPARSFVWSLLMALLAALPADAWAHAVMPTGQHLTPQVDSVTSHSATDKAARLSVQQGFVDGAKW